jgi:hypothetical protein
MEICIICLHDSFLGIGWVGDAFLCSEFSSSDIPPIKSDFT